MRISGFSDEISCSLILSKGFSKNDRHILTVRNGLDSSIFQGGTLAFNISEIRNPRTTMETNTFTLDIYDSSNDLQYSLKQNTLLTIKPTASPFLYASVTPSVSPPQVGHTNATYVFTLTPSIDLEVNTFILIELPPEILFSGSNLTCRGLLSLSSTRLKCERRNERVFVVNVWGTTATNLINNGGVLQNGTSVSFEVLNAFRGPLSLEPSASFRIATYEASDSNTRYYYYNEESEGLVI